MNQDLKKIKKLYGESMAKFCRESFSTLLEEEGLLVKLLTENFAESHFLFNDIVNNRLKQEFKKYIYGLVSYEPEEIKVDKTPEELMSEAGYDLYECKTEKDIQSFKKYYAPGEELCTFNGGRLNSCNVFFAVKKNVSDIKRENFKSPERQDLYGTSVISIQFTKDGTNTLSIKNRYNHRVVNPDATYTNNLDNIIEGLTDSFAKYYGMVQKYKNTNFEIPEYVRARDGRYYKYNYEIDNIYYCPDNVIDSIYGIEKYEKEKYLVFDYFVLDIVNKTLNTSFGDSLIEFIGKIKKIEIMNIPIGKEVIIISEDDFKTNITLDKRNRLIKFKSDIKKRFLGAHFLIFNKTLEELELPNIQFVAENFLAYNEKLNSLKMPRLKNVQDKFLDAGGALEKIELPYLEKVGDNFMRYNSTTLEINVPNLREVGANFLANNVSLNTIHASNLEKVGSGFLCYNDNIEEIDFPNLRIIKDSFLVFNTKITKLILPNALFIGSQCLWRNKSVTEIDLPNVITCYGSLGVNYDKLEKINMPMVRYEGLDLELIEILKNKEKGKALIQKK